MRYVYHDKRHTFGASLGDSRNLCLYRKNRKDIQIIAEKHKLHFAKLALEVRYKRKTNSPSLGNEGQRKL